ncbi:MAG: cytochrome c-type biogenesis protein CcmH [Micavibrio sp.]|nr:cytochrome c-type biogenesis protein CcmH [Micavibrio sp.]
MKYVFALLLFLAAAPAFAVQPDEMLKDPAMEARARSISRGLRCLVCQGEDIDESNAGLAADIRKLVRERLTAGDSDAAVLQFVQARYGDYVLMNPPVRPGTYLLWFAPLIVLCIGGGVAFAYIRRQNRQGE